MSTIDFDNLSFAYHKTNTILYTEFKNGKWSEIESRTDDYISISAFAE